MTTDIHTIAKAKQPQSSDAEDALRQIIPVLQEISDLDTGEQDCIAKDAGEALRVARAALSARPSDSRPWTPDGAALIAEERKRQVEKDGWSPEHDDAHSHWELSLAARCYAVPRVRAQTPVRPHWPWRDEEWKPSDDPVRNLVKAGALIAAEIDRLQRRPLK